MNPTDDVDVPIGNCKNADSDTIASTRNAARQFQKTLLSWGIAQLA